MTPTISVVIPTLARNIDELLEAIASAQAQTLAPLEVLVVDDRADGVPLGLPIRTPGVRILVNRGRHGPSAARNAGTQAARGTHVAFLDDDDYWLPTKLRLQVDALHSHADRDVVIFTQARVEAPSGTWIMPEEGPEHNQPVVDFLFREPDLLRATARGFATPTMLTSRSLLRRTPFDEDLHTWEDVDWLLRVVDDGARVVLLREPLAVVRHALGATTSQSYTASANGLRDWADAALDRRSPRAANNFRLTYVVPHLISEGRRREAWSLGVRTVLTRDVDARPVVKFMARLSSPHWLRARLAALSRGSFRGVAAGRPRKS